MRFHYIRICHSLPLVIPVLCCLIQILLPGFSETANFLIKFQDRQKLALSILPDHYLYDNLPLNYDVPLVGVPVAANCITLAARAQELAGPAWFSDHGLKSQAEPVSCALTIMTFWCPDIDACEPRGCLTAPPWAPSSISSMTSSFRGRRIPRSGTCSRNLSPRLDLGWGLSLVAVTLSLRRVPRLDPTHCIHTDCCCCHRPT